MVLIASKYWQEHLFIVTELLRANLYEFQKYNQESGGEVYFTLPRIHVCSVSFTEMFSLGPWLLLIMISYLYIMSICNSPCSQPLDKSFLTCYTFKQSFNHWVVNEQTYLISWNGSLRKIDSESYKVLAIWNFAFVVGYSSAMFGGLGLLAPSEDHSLWPKARKYSYQELQ